MADRISPRATQVGRTTFLVGLSLMLAAALVFSTQALAALKVGTDSAETLTGTNSGDHITGKGGNDTLKGLAGNDVYHFDDGFGRDTLEELVAYKVGKKKVSGGTDSLNFSQVQTSMNVYLTPEWPAAGVDNVLHGNQAHTADGGGTRHRVSLGSSRVEKVTGGRRRTTSTAAGFPTRSGPAAAPATACGTTAATTTGPAGNPRSPRATTPTPASRPLRPTAPPLPLPTGEADSIILPGDSSAYYLDSVDLDSSSTTEESLQIYDTVKNSSIFVYGHFGPNSLYAGHGQRGRIERIVFQDETITSTAEVGSLARTSSERKGATQAHQELIEAPTPEPSGAAGGVQ